MKLCRFELHSDPNTARSGIVYGGRIYETDGAQPIGVHDFSSLRLLAPLVPRSVRWYEFDAPHAYRYLNPSALFDPGASVPAPAEPLELNPCLAVVLAGMGRNVSTTVADETVLGIGLGLVLRSISAPFAARAWDVGFVIGPALTTPDGLAEISVPTEVGMTYQHGWSLEMNEQPTRNGDLSDLQTTVASLISEASTTCALAQSDVFLIPLSDEPVACASGDRAILKCEPFGALTMRAL